VKLSHNLIEENKIIVPCIKPP